MSALRQGKAILAVQLREAMGFRADVVILLVRAILSIGVYYYLWRAVFAARPHAGGLSFSFMVAYIVLVQIVQGLTRPPNIARELAQAVQDGSIALHFLRPYNLQLFLLAQTLATVFWHAVWVVVPLFAAGLVLGVPLASPKRAVWFVVSLPLALAVNVGIEAILGLATVWLRQNEGLVQFKNFLRSFFSGALVPLALFPGPLAALAKCLPFRSTVDVPIGLYLGYLGPEALAVPASWAAGLWLLSALILIRAQKRISVFGG
ncbi:MAG: ABC transporter permease [Candidatus Bipolaricaulaceae bacterium]